MTRKGAHVDAELFHKLKDVFQFTYDAIAGTWDQIKRGKYDIYFDTDAALEIEDKHLRAYVQENIDPLNSSFSKEALERTQNAVLTSQYIRQTISNSTKKNKGLFNRNRLAAIHYVFLAERAKRIWEKEDCAEIRWQLSDLEIINIEKTTVLLEFKLGDELRPLTFIKIEKFKNGEQDRYAISGCSYTKEGEAWYRFIGKHTIYDKYTSEIITNFAAELISSSVEGEDQPQASGPDGIIGNTHFILPSVTSPVTKGYYFDVKGHLVNFFLVDTSWPDLPPELKDKPENIDIEGIGVESIRSVLEGIFVSNIRNKGAKCRDLF